MEWFNKVCPLCDGVLEHQPAEPEINVKEVVFCVACPFSVMDQDSIAEYVVKYEKGDTE